MRILCVADEEDKGLWDFYTPDKLKGYDLILSSGDLHPDYLQFLVTMAGVPLLYVHGNHDTGYERNPPFGCECIEDTVFNFHGLRILGLGGSMKYKEVTPPYMYTEIQMKRRIARLSANLMLTNGFDILLTHSPMLGYGDQEDLPHRGFACFDHLVKRYKPLYMIHGHVHKAYGHFQRERLHPSGTRLINTCGAHSIMVEKGQFPARGKTGSPLYDLYTRMQKEPLL
ncbi:MAG: metallophosphoesterase family protein [Blautia sp.]|nr:metallophosphoesterase family protein [Blautia sp.]